jgi:transcriptional regulator with XRE-family HTH domain
MAGRGKANEIDAVVGRAIKLRRTALGMSQDELGRGLNLTFQQIQKFEGGSNRVSARYLFEMTKILNVPISYFFGEIRPTKAGRTEEPLQAFWMTQEGLALWRTFSGLPSDSIKRRVLDLVVAIAKNV